MRSSQSLLYAFHTDRGSDHPPLMPNVSPKKQKSKATVSVDKHGFLSEDNTLDFVKEKNEIRIATIGGSATANINLPFNENWPGYIGHLVQKMFPDSCLV